MKKTYLLLSLVIVITFIGGFLTGVLFSGNDKSSEDSQTKEAKPLPFVSRELVQKEVPKIEKPQHVERNVVMGYVQDFREMSKVNYSDLTHVIFSFAHPEKDGSITFNGEMAIANLKKMVTEAHKSDTKAILAVGGWYHIKGGESYEYFKEAITNPSTQKKLVNELIKIVERENLDGIDIDFEHPRSNDDAKNLKTFMAELSTKLHGLDKELSIAVNAKVHSVAGTELSNVVYDPLMFNDVDYVNIMAYDGQWDGEYNAANLSPLSHNVNIVNYWSDLFDQHHLSKGKLILGIPLYAQPENPEAKQLSYAAIINDNPTNRKNDLVTINGKTYHYNGEETVKKKIQLAHEHGFGGMMVWETGLDAQGKESLTSFIANNLK